MLTMCGYHFKYATSSNTFNFPNNPRGGRFSVPSPFSR